MNIEENLLLKKELNKLTNKLQQNEKNREIEKQEFVEREKQHIKDVEKLKSQVTQYCDEIIELKVKIETLSITEGTPTISQLPSAICQLETKIRELYKQNEEQQLSHEEEINRLVGECDDKSQKTAAMMVMNALLKSQLSELEGRIGVINDELVKCRKQMQQELLEKEMEVSLLSQMQRLLIQKKSSEVSSVVSLTTLSQVLDEVSLLQKDLRSTEQETMKDLAALNQELFAINGKLIQLEEQQQKVQEPQLSAKEKDNELNKEISILQSTIHEIQREYKEMIETKDKELNDQVALNEELKAKNTELSLEIEQQRFEQESAETKTMQLKQAVNSVIAMLTEGEDPIISADDERVISPSSEALATRVVSITEEWFAAYKKRENEKTNSMTGSMMKKTIESLQGRIENLQEANAVMEVQIEEIDNQKLVTERKLVLSEGSVKQYVEEMEKLQDLKQQMEKKLTSVEEEANTFRQKENEAESTLRKKALVIKSLELQLQSSQDEIAVLQKTVSRLNAEKTECDNYINDIKLQMKSSESEKEGIQQEIASVQELNKSLLVNVVELQRANSILEVEKRSLQEAMSSVSNTKVQLNLENTELAKQQMVDKNELLHIQATNKQLNFKIEELDKNLSELELTCKSLKTEKEELSQEASVLNEVVTNLRTALSEVQIQRGKLSQSIAKVAQENGELIQTKLQLTSEKTHLQATSKSLSEKLDTAISDITQLKSQRASLEVKLAEAIKEAESLTERNLSLQTQKQQMLEQQSKVIESKNEAMSQMQAKHTKELEKLSTEANAKEAELQKLLAIKNATHSQQIANTKNGYEGRLASYEQELLRIKEDMASELATMEEKHKDEITKLKSNEEACVRNLEEKLEILIGNHENQKMVLEKKLMESESAKHDAESTIVKMKAELSANRNTIDELGRQTSANEQELKQLQHALDDIKRSAQKHLDDLQTELLEANTTAKEFEHRYKTSKAANKHLQESQDYCHSMLEEAQSSIDQLQQERDVLAVKKRNLEKESEERLSLLENETKNASNWKVLRNKSEKEKDSVKEECGQLRQSLLLAEGSLAKLSLEHQQLLKLMVQCHKETEESKTQFTTCKAENETLLSKLEANEAMVDQLKEELSMVTAVYESKLSELENTREILRSVKEDKEKLQLSFAQLEEMSLIQAQENASAIASLKKSVQETKEKKDKVIKDMNNCEMNLKKFMGKASELQSECDALKQEIVTKDAELCKTVKLQQNTQAAYDSLADVLVGCFNKNFREDVPREGLSASYNTAKASSRVLDTYKVHQAIRALQATSMELKNVNMRLEEENNALKTSSAHFNTTRLALESEKAKLETAQSLLQSKQNEVIKEKLKLEEDIGTKNEDILRLKKQVSSLQTELKNLKTDLENSDLATQAQVAHVSSILQDLLENEVAKTKAIARLKQMQSVLQMYEEKNTELEKRVKDLMTEISKGKAERSQLDEAHKSLQRCFESSERKIENLQKEAKELKKSMGSSAVTMCDMELNARRQEKKITELQEENRKVSSTVDDLSKKLQVSQENEHVRATQFVAIKQEKEKLEESFNLSFQELTEIKSKIDQMRRNVIKSESESSSLKASIENLKSEKVLLEEQLSHYKNSEKSLKEKVEKVEKALECMKTEVCEGLRIENAKLQNSLKESENKIMQIQDELKIALEHGQVVQGSLVKHNQQVKQLAKNNSELTTKVKFFEGLADEMDKKRIQEVEAQKQQVTLVQAEIEFLRKIWKAEEHGLKESIEEQERKILMLEEQLHCASQGRHDSPLLQGVSYSNRNKKQQKKTNTGRYGSTGDDDSTLSSDNY